MYNLELDSAEDVLSAGICDDADLNSYDDMEEVENSEYEDEVTKPVKVLNHKTNDEKININEIRKLPSLLNVEF